MRAKEFINEEKKSSISKSAKKATPGLKKFPQMDNSYGIYRFGIAMASSPGTTDDAVEGPIGNVPIAVAYSKGEEEIIKATLKQVGDSSVTVTPSGSSEQDDTYKTSPIAAPKRNKYGV
jgi:hypothetical protein